KEGPVREVLTLDWWHGLRRRATQAAVRAAVTLGRWVGPGGGMELGRAFGTVSGLVGPLRQRLATNLRRAGGGPTPGLRDRYFHRLGCWAGWSLAVYQAGFDRSGVAERLVFDESVANLDRAAARGRGVVLSCPHLFCHEMAAAAVHRRHPVVALVRESKD